MQVILLERVENLGQMGDVVTVKNGYARNFLLPRKRALRATKANIKQFEAQKAQLEAENLQKRSEAEAVAKSMEKMEVILIRQAGEIGQLYGSVNARDVANAVKEAGVTIDKKQVSLVAPIKSLGLFDVKVDLHAEVSVLITANVARSEEEAKLQRETGAAIVASEDDDEMEAEAEAPIEVEAEELAEETTEEEEA